MMWFKVYDWQLKYLEKESDADVGAGLKAALRMLSGKPVGELSPGADDAFRGFRPRVAISLDIKKAKKEGFYGGSF